ncbi:MAG TPA: DUF4388 domain-containing protein [Candidatus Binatia bacterium]
MQGTLAQISLTDVLQLCILAKKSGLLKLTRGKETVEIYFDQGEVVHAVSPLGEGEKAFFHPLTWTEGSFAMVANGAVPTKTVTRPTADLLASLLGLSREMEQIQQVVPSESAVFRIAEADDGRSAPVTLTPDQWRVLSRVNGARSVKAIAEAVRLPYMETAKIICALHKETLLAAASGGPAPKSVSEFVPRAVLDPVPPGFFDRMVHGLAEVSGPIASVVVRDQIAALGVSEEAFPKSRIPELIESVSQVIPDKKLKARFQQKMSEEIGALKAPAQKFTM